MKYKVLREFVNKKGSLYKPGDTADWGSLGEFGKALLRNGFVEPIKEPKIEACFDYKDPEICEEVVNEIKR